MRFLPVSVFLSVLAVATAASAETITPTAEGDRVRYDLAIDLPITFIAGSVWLGSQLLQPALALPDCRWCDRDAQGNDTLNAFDKGARNAFRWENTGAAGSISDVLGYGVIPVTTIGLTAVAGGLDGRLNEAPANALLILEASFTAATITQLVKFAVGRERPFVHVLDPEEKKKTKKPTDNNVSFFSAHSNFAFALAVSSGTVATLRGYRYAPLVWATGVPIAASIAYLRVAADKHYMSDVLLGSFIGTATGFAVPFLFHRGAPAKGSASPSAPGGTSAQHKHSWKPSGIDASGTSFSIQWEW